MKQLLVEKYRPHNLDEYVFQSEDIERKIRKLITDELPANVLFVSGPGQGKSTISKIIVNELDLNPTDVKWMNASIESGIGFIRETLEPWMKKTGFSGMKVVQIEEMDRMSKDAYYALRSLQEEYSDRVRFIGTANYIQKIDPAILSRFQVIEMGEVNEDAIINRIIDILEKEEIHIQKEEDLLEIIEAHSPDLRKIINTIDQCTSDGVLYPMSSISQSSGDEGEWEAIWKDESIKTDDLLGKAIELCGLVDQNNFEWFYQIMYENSHQFPDQQKAIILLSKYLDRALKSANQKLHLEACLYHIFVLGEDDE